MSETNSTLTQRRLQELLHYDPDIGVFTWRVNASSTGRAGTTAGCRKSSNGYIVIRVDGKLYLAHRLAFLYMEGRFPPSLIDHRDTVKSNNRWTNLRCATQSENQQNRIYAQANNRRSGLLGVYWSEQRGAWGAKVVIEKKQHHAGFHATPELAHQAYLALKRKLHPYGTM